MNYKIGSKVIVNYSKGTGDNTIYVPGYIINSYSTDLVSMNYVVLIPKPYTIGEITTFITGNKYLSKLDKLSKIRDSISNFYDNKISELESKLIILSKEDKLSAEEKQYADIKKHIITNCSRMTNEGLTDDEFINRLKEIYKLKKQLHNPEKLPIVIESRKKNGTIKYEIRQLKSKKSNALERVSDDKIFYFYHDRLGL